MNQILCNYLVNWRDGVLSPAREHDHDRSIMRSTVSPDALVANRGSTVRKLENAEPREQV
jgi:hypothetical protein